VNVRTVDKGPRTAVPADAHYGGRFTGSKGGAGVAQRIVSLLPCHSVYLEIFGGRGTVGRLKRASDLELYVERDPSTAAALRSLVRDRHCAHVVNADCMAVLDPTRTPADAVLYADPPYLDAVRSSRRRYYRHEFATSAEHVALLEWLKTFRCHVLVSGYPSSLYDAQLEGWRQVLFGTSNRAGNKVTESVWLNFPQPTELHDPRFVGDGYRERERIKRKVTRWRARLARMPAEERAALVAAIADPLASNDEQVPPAAVPFERVQTVAAPPPPRPPVQWRLELEDNI
jgi:DNA adenine methylase